jgi:predicted AlkP superfamily pyrophosphatase or phosphodiesterase
MHGDRENEAQKGWLNLPPAVLLLIDGLRPDALDTGHCPRINNVRRMGAATMQASSVMPSVTLPCHMSIFYGVPPTRHGITTNLWTPMARPLPGLVEVAQKAGLRSAFFYNWEELRDLSRPGGLVYSCFRDNNGDAHGDQVIAEEAARFFSGDGPDFCFIYLGALDSFGHRYGWLSGGYFEQLERTDLAVGTVLDALPADATVLLLSDHGGHDRIHGTDVPEDMTIPWMVAGPNIQSGHTINSPVTLMDTAPTVARVLGVKPDPEWEGQCVEEVFA